MANGGAAVLVAMVVVVVVVVAKFTVKRKPDQLFNMVLL